MNRALAWMAAATLAFGCASAAPVRSRSGHDTPRPSAEQPALPRFDGLDDLADMTTTHALRTAHPIGPYAAVLRVGRGADGYGARGRSPMPEGAVIVESLSRTGDPTRDTETHYVMRKREPGYFAEGGDWEYAVADAEGTVQARGRLKLCARCHAEAPREFLFEPPRGPDAGGTASGARTTQFFPHRVRTRTALPPL